MAGSIILFFFSGLFLDSKFNLKGAGIIIFLLLGIICGFYFMYTRIIKMIKEDVSEKKS